MTCPFRPRSGGGRSALALGVGTAKATTLGASSSPALYYAGAAAANNPNTGIPSFVFAPGSSATFEYPSKDGTDKNVITISGTRMSKSFNATIFGWTWTAPTQTEGRCAWLEFGDEELAVTRCSPKGYEHQVGAGAAYAVYRLGRVSILAGECGYGAVQFIHRDRSVRTVPCSDGLVFETGGTIA